MKLYLTLEPIKKGKCIDKKRENHKYIHLGLEPFMLLCGALVVVVAHTGLGVHDGVW